MKDGRELVVGSSRDPVFGPTILFGAGGTLVEVLRDSAVSLPSLNAVLANRLINRTRVSRLLSAFRDKPAVDREAVIGVLLRISDLVCELAEIDELDINPLLANPQGVICMKAGAEQGAADCNFNISVFDAEFDTSKQINQLEDAATSGRFEVFVVQPVDSIPITSTVQDAMAARTQERGSG